MNTLHLEVNDAGGWRRVMSFDPIHQSRIFELCNRLLPFGNNQNLRARIIAPGTTAPLMTWTNADGWKEWRS